MMGKDGRRLNQHPTPLQLVFKVAERAAAIHLHEFGFEETFNGISSHIHGTAPSPSIEEGACIVQTVCAGFGLFTYASVEVM